MRLSEAEARRLAELRARPPKKKVAKPWSPWDASTDDASLQRFVRHARDAATAERRFAEGARDLVLRARYEAALALNR